MSMRTIAHRIWLEPVVFLAVLSSLAIAILAVLNGQLDSVDDVAQILAPIVAALGARQLVTPDAKTELTGKVDAPLED